MRFCRNLAAAALLPMFWVKLAFAASLVAASLLAALRLSRPGLRLAGAAAGLLSGAIGALADRRR